MRKYLALAATLGAVAFFSVSWMAQAHSNTVPPAAANTTTMKVAPEFLYAKDRAECDVTLPAAAQQDAATKAAALKTCLLGRSHTEEEITAEEAKRAAAAIAPSVATTPSPSPLNTTPPTEKKQ